MELNKTPQSGQPQQSEALQAISIMENELRKLHDDLKDADPLERIEKFTEAYKKQMQFLGKMIQIAEGHMATKMQACAVPRKTGTEIISLAYDMMNFAIAINTRQLAAMQGGLNLDQEAQKDLPKEPGKDYSPIITELN